MSKIFVDLGAEPWAPSAATRSVEVLDFYNIPLAGIVSQRILDQDEFFLYVCAAGEEDDTNVWFYAPIDEQEIEKLLHADEETFVASLANTLCDKMLVAALAQDWRVSSTATVDAGRENPGILVRRVLKRLLAGIQHTERNLEALLETNLQETQELVAS